MLRPLRLGARPSQLALAQARLIKAQLENRCLDLSCEVIAVRTTGDKLTTAALAQVGGKGLFVRELEEMLSAGGIDLAIHSMKDLPAALAPGFRLAAVPVREAAADVLIGSGLMELPHGARLGTASLRRKFQALRQRPDLDVRPLRGNVDTRLARLKAGDYAAIILAGAGLRRLGLGPGLSIRSLPEEDFVPAGGQGALAIEAWSERPVGGSAEIEAVVRALEDVRARCEINAERAYLAAIGASCASPVGVKASAGERTLTVRAMLFSLDGSQSMTDVLTIAGTPDSAFGERAGAELADRMLANGAGTLIEHGG